MKSLREQIRGKCKHFNGLGREACDAGVAYISVRIEGRKFNEGGYPCFRWDGEPKNATCEACEFLTEAEVDAAIADRDASWERIKRARASIVSHFEATAEPSGRISCPNCKGVLRYSRASINGRIHAGCSTKGCAAWME